MKAATVGLMLGASVVMALGACGGPELEADETGEALSVEAAALGTAHPEFVRKLRDIEHYRLDEARLLGGSEESLCGTRDLQHVNSYDGRLGVSQTYVKKFKGAVGALTSKNTASGSKYCTEQVAGQGTCAARGSASRLRGTP